MYKVNLKITLMDIFDINIVESSISWMEKAELVNVVNQYIKQRKLIEIVKNYRGYTVTWDDEKSFNNFISEVLYNSIVSRLQELGVSITWKE